MNEKARELLATLEARGLTLASVESLTGGMFGSVITSVPGASKVYRGGAITYSWQLKEELGVRDETIERVGVVSQEVAAEMAISGSKRFEADITVSCTGNAGPDVEKGGKAVGCVYLGLVYKGSAWTIPLQLGGDREEIRSATVDAMIAFVVSLFPKEKIA